MLVAVISERRQALVDILAGSAITKEAEIARTSEGSNYVGAFGLRVTIISIKCPLLAFVHVDANQPITREPSVANTCKRSIHIRAETLVATIVDPKKTFILIPACNTVSTIANAARAGEGTKRIGTRSMLTTRRQTQQALVDVPTHGSVTVKARQTSTRKRALRVSAFRVRAAIVAGRVAFIHILTRQSSARESDAASA